jgi:hypothetical protein
MLARKNNMIRFAMMVFVIFSLSLNSYGQISPGELSQVHAHLEGMLNCTKCHILGEKVSNEKCLDCHKEIKNRLDSKKGYHASSGVVGKDCFSCHSDHHGRNFEIIRFDADRFNHQLTGYALTGAHMQLDCNKCHNDELIDSYELKKKKQTYLGLQTECVSCHKDVHQKTLSVNCASCHNTEKFAPAVLFEHNKTDFALRGKHKTVDCKKCHQVTFTNDALFQRFAGVAFNSCVNCHDDVHDGRLGKNCSACHSEESFFTLNSKNAFNHNQTDFPLIGKHRRLDCAACHKVDAALGADKVFLDYKDKDFQSCVTCHKDIHDKKFGPDCKKCHNEESFHTISHLDQFDHNLTDYPLAGKHIVVDCRKCHENKMTDPVAHNRCADCHHDFHRGEFIRNDQSPDCRDCHDVDGFSNSSYSIEQHNKSAFPLEGAHAASPCIACHLNKDVWSFRIKGQRCNDCHKDIHEGFLNEKYYPDKTCNSCHSPEGWADVTFDHSRTTFPLEGKHKVISCQECHKSETNSTAEVRIPFSGLKQDCIFCHDDIHDHQFEVNGVTLCSDCHGFEGWKPSRFDHSKARFVLDGAHKNVLCVKCHKEEIVNGRVVIQYRLEEFACVTCHK